MTTSSPPNGSWTPFSPSNVADVFLGYRGSWWIAGGWAIDLFLGRQTRSHEDTDVAVLRADQAELQHHLADWDMWLAEGQRLRLWGRSEPIPRSVNSIWCRQSSAASWGIELLLMKSDGHDWVYRRKPSVRRPIHSIGRLDPTGIPYLAPEIQLLFKAKFWALAKNEADFSGALPRLGSAELAWLSEALVEEFPDGHEWLGRVHSRRREA